MPISESEAKAAVENIRKELDNSKGTHIWQDYVNALRLVSQVVFTRSSGFVLELIQNAEDAGQGLTGTGEVTITINKDRLKFVHNGAPFTESNLRAICGIRSSKKPEAGTLGYLGIGFKSVFKVADCAEIYSSGFRFKFDRNHADWANQVTETPWHVIPIWVDQPSEAPEQDKTTFIVRLRNEEAYDHLMSGLKEIRAELYLFLKWIKRIQITDEISGDTWSLEDLGEDQNGITTLKQDSTLHRFKFFRDEIAVPGALKADRLTQEYRANVTKRAIAIAFAMDEKGNLDPSPATAMYGGVYSFLPLGESKSGAKFPIQADFLVQPGREGVNEEAAWNHWLLENVTALCKTAVAFFQNHAIWKFQYLGVFEFTKAPGYEHESLFRPKLIEPLEAFLKDTPSVPTADGKWAKPSEVVSLTEAPAAAAALVSQALMTADEIAPILGGAPNLKLVHPKAAQAQPNLFKKVSRWTLFENDDFLTQKAASPDGPAWFRALYLWLNNHPVYEDYFYYKPKKRILRYDGQEIILTANTKVVQGAGAWLLDLSSSDPLISKLAVELQQKKPTLHPDILGGAATEQERQDIKGLLRGLAGVNAMDTKAVCEEAILPKIVCTAAQPTKTDLLEYTKYCHQYLGAGVLRGKEIWVATKAGVIRPAREAYFPTEFKPPQNWEINKAYVKGLDFLIPDYIATCKDDSEIRAWREFMHAAGVRTEPDNGVEVFAMNYAKDKLAPKFSNFIEVDKLNHGYDAEAQDQTGTQVHIEVKGQSTDADVELTGNEAKAAKKHGQTFYLCVVSSIPESPVIHLVQDPDRVGEKEKLTVRVNDWKPGRWPPPVPAASPATPAPTPATPQADPMPATDTAESAETQPSASPN